MFLFRRTLLRVKGALPIQSGIQYAAIAMWAMVANGLNLSKNQRVMFLPMDGMKIRAATTALNGVYVFVGVCVCGFHNHRSSPHPVL